MKCASCGSEYKAPNQNGSCPSCGAKTGTPDERDLVAEHAEKVRWFEYYEEATQEAREFAHKCRDYYDGDQWSEADRAKLDERNQAPVVINRIFKKVNYLTGTEVNGRTDPKAYPRTPAHEDDVNAITDALRYVVDAEDFDKTGSDAWEEKLIEGASAAVVEIERDGDENAIKIRHVEYDRFFYDPHSRKADFSDAKYLGVSTWMDLEDAVSWFESRDDAVENAREVLEASPQHYAESEAHADKPSVWWDPARRRVRWTETYYRKDGVWYVCFASKGGFLVPPKKTGYRDEKGRDVCPLIADSAYINRKCERYGLVKHMLSVQDEINKRRSKALHWESVDRMVFESGALLDPDEAQTERSKPDGSVEVQRDALVDGRVQFIDGTQKAMSQRQMLAQSNTEIDMVGPDAPQIGTLAGDQSGRALMMRQQIGNLEIARLLDSHRRWKRRVYRHVWYAIRQFWPYEKWFRVTDDAEKTGYRFVGLNRRVTRGERIQELLQKEVPPESAVKAAGVRPQLLQQAMQIAGQQAQASGAQLPPEQLQQAAVALLMRHPVMEQPMVAGDTARLDVDVVLDESPDTAILQLEEYEAFTQALPGYLGARPDLAPKLLEIQLELSSHRYKRKVLQMLREPPSPQQAQAQQVAQQLQMEQAKAGLAATQAKAQRDSAAAAKTAAEAQASVPAAAQRDMAQAAKTGVEAQLGVPAAAHRDHAAAQKAEAEASPEVIIALATPKQPGPRP